MRFRKADTYSIFAQCVFDYSNQSILDFGGNRGNLISSSNGIINPEKYTCLDVSREGLAALPKGIKSIHWNRYHPYYNPNGNPEEPFPEMEWHDIVFANSVFTHHLLEEALYYIENLSKYTNRIVFTYIDPENDEFINKFRNKWYDLSFEKKEVSYAIGKGEILWSAFDTEYLKNHLPYNKIKAGTTDWFNYMDITVRSASP